MKKQESLFLKIEEYLLNNKSQFTDFSDLLWENPEVALEEVFACDQYTAFLKKEGFRVETGIGGLSTAFSASFGSGKPVIGILGEFDALPEMSQREDVLEEIPVKKGAPGHACGHNLLGVASLAAIVSLKHALEDSGIEGTVILFGCPAEERFSGKATMQKAGCFDALDAALTWHPSDMNAVFSNPTLANDVYKFSFEGVSAHASFTPYLGRSALDALELMCIGIQYLREHVKKSVTMHYAITNTGGFAPNIVQAKAEGLFQIRGASSPEVEEVSQRVIKIAEGAALMTGTKAKYELISSCESWLPNTTLAAELHRQMSLLDPPHPTEDEKEYAESIRETLVGNKDSISHFFSLMSNAEKEEVKKYLHRPFNDFILPLMVSDEAVHFSTDVGNVSIVCPVAQLCATTACQGTAGHTWQQTAQGKSSFSHKGMLFASRVIANTVISLLINPSILEEAKDEYKRRLAERH